MRKVWIGATVSGERVPWPLEDLISVGHSITRDSRFIDRFGGGGHTTRNNQNLQIGRRSFKSMSGYNTLSETRTLVIR